MCQDKVQKFLEKAKEPLTTKEISKQVDIGKGSVSRALARLIEQKIAKVKHIKAFRNYIPYYYI